MYDTDIEEAEQYNSQLCTIRSTPSSDSAVEVLQSTAEHVLEALEHLFRQEHAAFVAAVRIAQFEMPSPADRSPVEHYSVQLLIEYRIMLNEELMENDVRNIILAAICATDDPPTLTFCELHEIMSS